MKGFFKRICSLLCAGVLLVTSLGAVAVTAEETVDYSSDYEKIIANWEETLIGSSEALANIDYSDLDENDPIDAKIISDTNTAKKYLDGIAKPESGFSDGDEAIEYWNNLIYPGDTSAVWNTNAEAGYPVHELSGYLWEDIAPAPQASRSQFAQVTSAANRIQAMAKAYRIGDFTEEERENLKNYILWATEFLCEEWYALDTVRYGNWHDWNVGIPLALNNILVLLYEESNTYIVNEDGTTLMELVLTCINHFPPTHTMLGANLNWRSTINLIRGALAGSIGLVFDSTHGYHTIQSGMNGFEKVAAYVTSDDGFYASDGSFRQHHMYAYTGSYGANLINLMSQSMIAVSGTSFEITENNQVNNMYINAFKAYEPVLVNGQVMEFVYGRSVSAAGSVGGFAGGRMIISGIVRLSLSAERSGRNDAYKLKLLAKALLDEATSNEVLKYYSYYANSDLAVIFEALEILNDQSINLEEYKRSINTNIFYNMDRVVQHNTDYTLGLSLHSKRISAYESINGNNTRGWFQGSGMLYVYNDDYSKFADHYWYTINSYRLPGTTVLRGVAELPREEGNKNALGQNSYAGGASLGNYTAAGMLLHPVNQTLNAKKSWFMFDNEVVALGAGITANEGSTIETTIENIKLLDDNSNVFTVDGNPVSVDSNGDGILDTATNGTNDNTLNHNTVKLSITDYAHISGNTAGSAMGYYFPNGANINVVREARTGNNYQINPGSTADDKTPYTKNYLTMYYDHGANGTLNNEYSYVLLPGASAEETASYSENADIEILCNTEDAQAVYDKKLNMTGITFWNDKETTVMKNGAEWITSNGAASVMVSETDTEITLAVSDPTQLKTEKFCIEINAETNGVAKSHEDISVLQHGKKTIIEINPVSVVGNKGETKTITLTKGEYINQEEIVAPSITGETIGTKEGAFVSKALNISGSRPLSFSTDCTIEGIEVDRFGKIFVSDSVPIGKYTFNVTVSNDAGSSTAEFTVLVLTAVKSKTPTGAVAYYDFNDGYGSTATAVSQIKTSSAQNFDGDLSEGVEWVDGFVGTALKFDSIDDTLINDGGTGTNANSIGMQPSQSVFGGATEYDFWVKFDTDPTTHNSDQWIISKGSSSATSNIPWAIKVTKAGKLAFIWNAGAGTANNWKYSDALEWNEGEWYHINITHDSSYNVTFKRDGLTVGSGTTNTGITAINRVTSINSGEYLTANTAQYFNGTIDELYLGKAGGGEEIRLRSKVNFHLDGSDIEPQYIDFNDTASEPVLTSKTGHLFLGWYTDADCTQKYDFSSPVTTDITLYAKWIDCGKIPAVSVKNRILFYNFNEGYGTAVKTSGTKLSSVTSSMDVNATISSGAEWVQGFVGTAVKFDSLSDSLAMNKATGTNQKAIGMLPSESAFGGGTEYDFWIKLDVHPSNGEQMILAREHNATIPWNIKITADGEIGFAYGSNTFVLTEKLDWNVDEWYHINITHSSDFLATISRDGIAVGSGTTGKTCIGTSQTMRINSGNYFNKDNYFKGTIDELYLGSMGYAKTAYSRYKYTFNSNGGSDLAVQYLFGDETATEIIPTKDGYTFAGWYTDETLKTAYDFSALASADTTLYAKWEEEQPKPQLGDANQDGAIDTNDLVILRQYLLGTLEIDIDINLLDVASDGKIDLKDLIRYKKYFAHIADIG